MPELVPPESYDRVTPATADFYGHLAAGLALTLAAESAVRADLEVECVRFRNELAIAVTEMTQAQDDVTAAEQVLQELPVGASGWRRRGENSSTGGQNPTRGRS